MALNYKGLFGIFYKISFEVPYSISVLFAPGVIILPVELGYIYLFKLVNDEECCSLVGVAFWHGVSIF